MIALRGTTKSAKVASGADITLTFDTGGGAPQQGDIVLLFGGHGSDGASGGQGPNTGGYTQRTLSVTNSNVVGGFWYKVMGPSPDLTVVCEGGGDTGDGVYYAAVVLNGTTVDAAIFDQADTLVDSAASSAAPDCGAITVNTVGAWVIGFCIAELNDGTPGLPANYSQLAAVANVNDTDPASGTVIYREMAATGSENPPAFTGWANDFFVAITVAIRPLRTAASTKALPLAGTLAVAVLVVAASTQALPLGGSAASTVLVTSASTRALPLAGSSAGTVLVMATSTQAVPLSGSSAGAVVVAATSTKTIPLGGLATGTVSSSGVTATSTLAVPVSGSALGTVLVTSSSIQAIPFAGSATGVLLVVASSTLSLPLAGGPITGTVLVTAASTRSVPLGGSLQTTVLVVGQSTAGLPLSGTASGPVLVQATSSRALPWAGTTTGTVLIRGTSSAALPWMDQSVLDVITWPRTQTARWKRWAGR